MSLFNESWDAPKITMPNLRDIPTGAKFFTKIDIENFFWNLFMPETVTFKAGLYTYKTERLPFGWTCQAGRATPRRGNDYICGRERQGYDCVGHKRSRHTEVCHHTKLQRHAHKTT
eukprot:TRINITY_DN2236_c1_g1_i4.p6 TRINITY_DN2236_c1_g1~~TRINITY_DN2236_c1_g1_i4.p6  ORF type:complete len:116 (+),score=8.66 TRINITY_DN2236_c1_g1_i4:974-1321(+)